MKQSAVILNWSGAMVPAEGELSDDEIQSRFGGLMKAAVSAFRDDPSYIVEMAESASTLKHRRQTRAAKEAC